MKKLFLSALFGLTLVSGWAQTRVVLLNDTARLGVSPTALAKTYPPALATRSGEKGVFERHGKRFMDSTHASMQRFFSFMEANKKRLPVKGVLLQVQEFVRPDGSYDWVFCQFRSDTLTEAQNTALLAVLTDWYTQHPFPIRTTTGFQTSRFTQIGNVPQPRKPRRGPGIIATLEAARKTDRPDTVRMLAFNQLDLTDIPDVVYRFPKLEELDLSKNGLRYVPAELTERIPTLKRLSFLYNSIPDDSVFFPKNNHLLALNLQGNRLTRIPQAVGNNRRLESLWMGNNKLREVNAKLLRRLRRLNDLNLYNAGLAQLPKNFGGLRRLKVLDLYYNKLTTLPRSMRRMKRLEQLAIAHNDFTTLPATLGRLPKLQVLYTHHNRISQLPASLQKLKTLRVLDISYNWFTVPPPILASLPSLEELDMSNNNLQELPITLSSLKSLKKVYLRANPLSQGDTKSGPYAQLIKQLEANQTEVFY
ncbi:leucine-rich repeat-containing protein typical subtype [Fibrisoma limi BUZ 3]|uniref:Leucine-rich repeat-containing protein typical subtype n=1 Tax=Fibrisoma limi BUZ 3 TaxID=1185876 RepID=I2GM71_9BACT|nr:leucine-rich repeat domain-containing protein [Fibrisoma limi]CCH54998.1 leucine-rich repeat-containing protein typical subtype [Fibrisoma limi BUZ 3]